jgi:hypothetical protein
MKNIVNIVLLLCFLSFINEIKAQDYIYKSDGTKIECTVEGVESNSITYKEASKSSKSQSLNLNQASLIVLSNGQYLTLPTTNTKLDIARRSKNLASDIVVTKYAEMFEGDIRALSKNEIEILVSPGNNVMKIKGDEAIIAIYRNGGHALFKNPAEAIALLEYMLPQVIQIAEKNVGGQQQMAAPQNRPAHLQPATDKSATASSSVAEANPVSSSSGMTSSSTIGTVTTQPSTTSQPTQRPATVEQVAEPVRKESAPVSTFGTNSATASPSPSPSGLGTNLGKSPDELAIDFDEFSDKALQKIEDFTAFISIIASKETFPESANQAIDLALELFVDENVLVEVSTKGYNEVIKRKIRDYLNRLKLLKYDRVEIKWADINYVSNFRKGPDGNYYGSITVKQTFQGYKDNQVVYSDVTQKDVEIVIKGMEKSIQGQKAMVWDVLLSDIGVLDTK